ncbi:Tfp pilus assembly protein FimT [Selenomonas sp. WCT3]|uniref:pilus assembly FimT family protein n=1 Tax=Selenomonas sp. WCT3 TaxID=3158785 RepID=UPI0008839DDE|nr:Tfp pilus assembly protein FimT [Selenomonas ruminantium]
MKKQENKQQAGFVLMEVLMLMAIMALLGLVAIPSAMQFYREAAIEYETEHLLSDLRRTQSLNRLIEGANHGFYVRDGVVKKAVMEIRSEDYCVTVSSSQEETSMSHHYLPLVRVSRQWNGTNVDSGPITFKDNGELKNVGLGMMTLLICCEGWPQEGRKIMISKAGRIRVERVSW